MPSMSSPTVLIVVEASVPVGSMMIVEPSSPDRVDWSADGCPSCEVTGVDCTDPRSIDVVDASAPSEPLDAFDDAPDILEDEKLIVLSNLKSDTSPVEIDTGLTDLLSDEEPSALSDALDDDTG